jgi:hypothetical protein
MPGHSWARYTSAHTLPCREQPGKSRESLAPGIRKCLVSLHNQRGGEKEEQKVLPPVPTSPFILPFIKWREVPRDWGMEWIAWGWEVLILGPEI